MVQASDPLAGRRSVALEELADREWVLYHPDHGLAGIVEEVCRRAGFQPARHGANVAGRGRGAPRGGRARPALVPDNIVAARRSTARVLRLEPRLIRDVAVYARAEWSLTASAFVDVLREARSSAPAERVLRFTSKLLLVRRLAPLALVALALSACGGSSTADSSPSLTGARAKTTAAGTARFKLTITAVVGGSTITAETGTVSSPGGVRTCTSRSQARLSRRSSS